PHEKRGARREKGSGDGRTRRAAGARQRTHRGSTRRSHARGIENHLRPQSRRATEPRAMKIATITCAALLAAVPLSAGSIVVTQHAALATTSPYATQIGVEVMKRG